jgi:ectoine hydroxylase-related dioxygenase (phytanoyl-CoA dioxygenase family)
VNSSEILEVLDHGCGYIQSKLKIDDYKLLLNLVESQYKKNLYAYHPEIESENVFNGIENYHQLAVPDHKKIWTKERRTLYEDDLLKFKNCSLIKGLSEIFGEVKITNEDHTRSGEVYWRLVRPNQDNDIGPLHADSWFWDLQNGPIDSGKRRLKIWISIFNQSGKNGFRLISGSQKKKFIFQGERRDGKIKPVHDQRLEFHQDLRNIETNPGDFILFHDDLIHGGFVGGDKTRVSLEFTFLIKTVL